MQGNTSGVYDVVAAMPSLQRLLLNGPVGIAGNLDDLSSPLGNSLCTAGVRAPCDSACPRLSAATCLALPGPGSRVPQSSHLMHDAGLANCQTCCRCNQHRLGHGQHSIC